MIVPGGVRSAALQGPAEDFRPIELRMLTAGLNFAAEAQKLSAFSNAKAKMGLGS